jgi:hypothetical protein
MAKKLDPFTRYTIAPSGCWLWTGPLNNKGYGTHGGPLAHRMFYIRFVGEVPDGMELDHTCRITQCVNPAHLEPVTHTENVRRGIVGEVNAKRQRAKTHCKRGHEFTPENTAIDHRGHRACRQCSRMLHTSYYYKDLKRSRDYVREKQRERRTVHRAPG